MATNLSRQTVVVIIAACAVFGLCVGLGLGAAFFLRTIGQRSQLGRANPPASSRSDSQELKEPMLRMFADGFAENGDLGQADHDQARDILREADPLLARVKEENRRALASLKKESSIPNRPSTRERP